MVCCYFIFVGCMCVSIFFYIFIEPSSNCFCRSGDGPTILIIKDTEGYIYGGYASQPWERHGDFYGDLKSFLFQLYPRASIFRPTGSNSKLQWVSFNVLAFCSKLRETLLCPNNHLFGPKNWTGLGHLLVIGLIIHRVGQRWMEDISRMEMEKIILD